MAKVVAYLRPATLPEALTALHRPGTVVIGGGTKLNALVAAEPVEVLDLQALPLGGIGRSPEGRLLIGATVSLQGLADCQDVPAVVREAARREHPSTLRAMATVGGCVATADPSSELLAALLVHDAAVRIAVDLDLETEAPLEAVLEDRRPLDRAIVTAVAIADGGVVAVARTARTRADRPIVAAVARRTPRGELRLALTGVAERVVLVAGPGATNPSGPVDAVGRLDPPGDFRGSSEYRRALAGVLARRALEALG